MLPTQVIYPLFEANQVLSSTHLNQLFDFLHEQERLSRANLIGIGVVCGLEPQLFTKEDGSLRLAISSGCGISSEGHLISLGDDPASPLDDFEWYRPYSVPTNIAYRVFQENTPFGARPFPMWELRKNREDDDDALLLSSNFLRGVNQAVGQEDEKILVLFLECLAASNRNCSPNSCGDKGSMVSVEVRPLLIRKRDIDLLQARLGNLNGTAAYFSLTDALSNRLNLPSLKMPRWDVEARPLNGSTAVFMAFQRAMSKPLVEGLAAALQLAHSTFRPLLKDYPTNPFTDLPTAWAYLHNGSIEEGQHYAFYQYFYDHLALIIQAYEEFRTRGLKTMGLCMPDARLFPRHLFLANLGVSPLSYEYRHHFVPSAVSAGQQNTVEELRFLFHRLYHLVQALEIPPQINNLVGGGLSLASNTLLAANNPVFANPGLVGNFTAVEARRGGRENLAFSASPGREGEATSLDNTTSTKTFLPPRVLGNLNLPSNVANRPLLSFNPIVSTFFRPRLNTDIRITPSRLGAEIAQKAIPYHYRPSPLYQYWNYQLSKQAKARENLGYRAASWNTTDDFVLRPLHYDLENYNFLRVEGHIGQPQLLVMSELLSQRSKYRLPIDIVALKTGGNAENIALRNLSDCHFQDLQSLYEAFREELRCQLAETLKRFYFVPILRNGTANIGAYNRVPALSFLAETAPNYRFANGTVGAHYEDNLALHTPELPFRGDLPIPFYYYTFFIQRIVNLATVLPSSLTALDPAVFAQRYDEMASVMSGLNALLLTYTHAELNTNIDNFMPGVDEDELSDQLDLILYACKKDSLIAIHKAYLARREKLQENLLLGNFMKKHPGLQHKAGVPLGGTFVVVYHGDEQPDDLPIREGRFLVAGKVLADDEPLIGASLQVEGTNIGAATDMDGGFRLTLSTLPAYLLVAFAGFPSRRILINQATTSLVIDVAVASTAGDNFGRFANLAVGTVIADFYLPYLCCSDCFPVQFVLPKEPPSFSWLQYGCTNPNFGGEITLSPTGGTAPYEYSTDGGLSWQSLTEARIAVSRGSQIGIRDAEGTESVRRTIELTQPFVVNQLNEGVCNEEGTAFEVSFEALGGIPPYQITYGETQNSVAAGQTLVATIPADRDEKVVISDSSQPACEQTFEIKGISCEKALGCKLPCGGATTAWHYPFWIQRNQKGFSFEKVGMTVLRFGVLDASTGRSLQFNEEQLRELSERLSPDNDLNTAAVFTRSWNSALEKANEYLQAQLGDSFGSQEATVLALGLDNGKFGSLSTLRIAHYDCMRFELLLQLRFETAAGKITHQREWRFTEASCEYTLRDQLSDGQSQSSKGSLLAFAPERFNRCRPEEAAKATCEEVAEIKVQQAGIDREVYRLLITSPSTANEQTAMWLTEHGILGLHSGPEASVRYVQFTGEQVTATALYVAPNTRCVGLADLVFNRPDRPS